MTTPTTRRIRSAPLRRSALLRRFAREEDGAQAMEYAALAAGGCGVVGLLIALWESDPVQDAVGNLLTRAIEAVEGALGGVLPF